MKTAVMYGAGNIGRGFLGELFSRSGYEVVFIDVNREVVDALNREGQYPVMYVTNEGQRCITVSSVRAVDGNDRDAVVREIAACDIMATAVGVNVLKYIAAPIARGIELRRSNPDALPLDILICENLIDANHALRKMIGDEMDNSGYLDTHIGFVEASIGRMVPVMTPDMQMGNLLRVCVEPYAVLPVDRNGFRGEIPDIQGLEACDNFDFYIRRKLYVHNMGHAMAAYLGALRGDEYIWQAMECDAIRRLVGDAMSESAKALSAAYNVPTAEVQAFAEDLIVRFGNRALGDTVARVGRDLDRKLSAQDRIAGAIGLCREQGLPYCAIAAGVAAALRFSDGQPGAVAAMLENGRFDEVLRDICGLADDVISEVLYMHALLAISK